MAFDSTINLGNIVTIAVTIFGGLWAYHKWNMSIEIRHEQNKNQIRGIDDKVVQLDTKTDRLELKIDENTKTTNGVNLRVMDTNGKLDKHIITDDLIQKEILRRLDKIDDK